MLDRTNLPSIHDPRRPDHSSARDVTAEGSLSREKVVKRPENPGPPGGGHVPPRGAASLVSGGPAVVGNVWTLPLDQKLCDPAFQRVCLWQ